MKKVLEAALKTEGALRQPSAPVLAMMARLAALGDPEARPAILERLLAMTASAVEDAQGDEVPLAWARVRHASSLERAGRDAEAQAEVSAARQLVVADGERAPERFRLHLHLLDRALAKSEREEAERQLSLAQKHVPLGEMEEHPLPEHVVDLAAACARIGRVDDAIAIVDAVGPDERHGLFVENLPASTAFEREATWARPFLKRLGDFAREDDDRYLRAARVATLARLQTRLGWSEDARATLAGTTELLAERDDGDDPELDAIRADFADAAAGAGALDDALAVLASIPDAPNLATGLLRPLAKAGAPWRGHAMELARSSDALVQALLEIAGGDVERGAPEDARQAIRDAEEEGIDGAEWGAVARLFSDLGDTAAATAAAAKLRDVEVDVTDPFGSITLELVVVGAEAAGEIERVDELLATALHRVASARENPNLSRAALAAAVLGTALEIAEARAAKRDAKSEAR